MANKVTLPVPSVPIVRVGSNPILVEKAWYQLLQELARSHNALQADAEQPVDAAADISGVVPVENGGTERSTLTPYGVICGGTTATGATQSVAVGTAGMVLVSGGADALPSFTSLTMTDSVSGVIQYPEAQDYVVWLKVPFPITLVSLITRCGAGSCVLTVKRNTTAVGGLSNSVSTSEVTNAAVSGNVFSANDDLRLTLSSVSGTAQDVWFNVVYTRLVP